MFERSRLIRERKNRTASINVGRLHAWQTGYVREVQVRRMMQLVRQPHVGHYCEGLRPAIELRASPRASSAVCGDRIQRLATRWFSCMPRPVLASRVQQLG